jgi:hypothetical protein
MGRELVRQLVAEACNIAMCDVSPTGLAETQTQLEPGAQTFLVSRFLSRPILRSVNINGADYVKEPVRAQRIAWPIGSSFFKSCELRAVIGDENSEQARGLRCARILAH